MSTRTDFLGLELPANNEYNDSWDIPINKNFVLLDQEMESVSTEVQEARFSKTSLANFLTVAHYDDGTLRPTEEATDSANSPIYGSNYPSGIDYTTSDRLNFVDFETFNSREGQVDVQANISYHSSGFHYPNLTVSGPATSEGQPNFLTASGSEFILNGAPDPIHFNIGGYHMQLDIDISISASGFDGPKYLVAKRPTTTTVVTSGVATGQTINNAANNNKVDLFTDISKDFVADGVRAGMTIQILGTGDNAGKYVVLETSFNGDPQVLRIIGDFKSAVSLLDYSVSNDLQPEFSIEDTYVEEPGKCIIGEATYLAGTLGGAITYAFKNQYESGYVGVDVSTLTVVETVLNHNLGKIPRTITIYITQASDGSLPLEPMSVCGIDNDLATVVSNTVTLDPGVWDPGASGANYNPLPSLSGDVTVNLQGGVFPLNAVRVKFTKTQIFIKNITDNFLYRDYDDNNWQQGFYKVFVR